MRSCALTVGVGTVATLAGMWLRPSVTLRPDRVLIAATPHEIREHLRARFAEGPDVLAATPQRVVRRFAGRAGAFRYRTTELVTFDESAISFSHLAGPFAACDERFDFHLDGESTALEHTGTFRLRGGVWTWAIFAIPVRRAFEAHVGHHLDQLALELSDASDTSDLSPRPDL